MRPNFEANMNRDVRRILYSIAIGLAIGLLLAPLMRQPWIGLLIGVVLTLILVFWPWRERGDSGESDAYDEMLAKARGDRALVERLVKYELDRDHAITRAQAVNRALDRWSRDSR
jgi:hypothetical protein